MSEHWFRGACPNCGDRVQQHAKSAWCLSCGWARNRYVDPASGRPVARWGLLGTPGKTATK